MTSHKVAVVLTFESDTYEIISLEYEYQVIHSGQVIGVLYSLSDAVSFVHGHERAVRLRITTEASLC